MTLEFRDVALRVGDEIHIHPTSFALADGGFNMLLGTTLSGKTTLMHLMAGLVRPTSGEIWFNGKNVTGVPVQKRNVSLVHQQFINYPNLSCLREHRFAAAGRRRRAGRNRPARRARWPIC